MVVTTFTPAGTASGVLALSKSAWRVGISISGFDHNDKIVDSTVKDLAGELKCLGNECDLVCNKLERVVSKNETGPPPPYDVDDGVWKCLAMQVEEAGKTIQELEDLITNLMDEASKFIDQGERLKRSDKSKTQIAHIRTRVWRHTEHLRTTMQLIETALAHHVPDHTEEQLTSDIGTLEDMVQRLQVSSQSDPSSRHSDTEITLIEYARQVIERGSSISKTRRIEQPAEKAHMNTHNRVSTWLEGLETIRQDSLPTHVSKVSPAAEAQPNRDQSVSAQHSFHKEIDTTVSTADDSDDDLDVDLAKAAIDTGTTAFDNGEWIETNSLLHEAIRLLLRLSNSQRAFCDSFDLHYKLAVCAYHVEKSADAEIALMALLSLSPTSNEQRKCICNALNLLSQLCLRTGQIDRARIECEKALHARRRLLGKQSDAALESLALMAHIAVLSNSRALAKSYLSMIPDSRREATLAIVEQSLDGHVEHLDFASLLAQPTTATLKDLAAKPVRERLSGSTLGYSTTSPGTSPQLVQSSIWNAQYTQSPVTASRQLPLSNMPEEATTTDQSSAIPSSGLSLRDEKVAASACESPVLDQSLPAESRSPAVAAASPVDYPEVAESLQGKPISRKELLKRVGCQPRDRIEEAVCNGDHSALVNLLNKKKGFWRSALRKRVRPERVTALHFAALLGEVGMARQIIDADYTINEIPFGYSTSLTPLHFAIGARQVDMVDFLTANGARPTEPDNWSTLASQLLSRSWLAKTMSEVDKRAAPSRIVAIMRTLIRHGWDVNNPIDSSGKIILHQAVAFWTGDYRWDINLRNVVTAFLCDQRANPLQPDNEGKTANDLALELGHQELVLTINRTLKLRDLNGGSSLPVELPAR